jgi:hypothetical protein
MTVERIISGGQTGADQGGLEAAIAIGIPHGGWCPRGRRADDGRVPLKYTLREAESPAYPERTRLNVQEADATVIFANKPSAGSALTLDYTRMFAKPVITVDPNMGAIGARRLANWLRRVKPKTLNVAGHRESSSPGIEVKVKAILCAAISTQTSQTERAAERRKRCTCEQFGNGVVSGQVDPPAPAGRLRDPACPKHGTAAT